MRGNARAFMMDVAFPGSCFLVYLRLLCLWLDGHRVTSGFISYSRYDVPTPVCYKRPHPKSNHGSSTGFDSRVVLELPPCSPKQLRTFTLRPILKEHFTRCRIIWGTPCALAHHHSSEHIAAYSERLRAPLPGFASRAPLVRRSPTGGKASVVKRSRSGTALRQKSSNPSVNRRPSASSYRRPPGTTPESAEPGYQYDEFLASFHRRIDGMTGQSGGWGF